jgi:hypothetical protein
MKINFAKDQWSMQDWMIVKYPGLAHEGSWIQKDDCIINATPEDANPEDMCEGGRYATDTFVGMVLHNSFDSPKRVASTMSFDYKMAPLIDIVCELDSSGQVPVLQERYEVVIYDKGINVWEHFMQDGKIKYRRILFYQRPLMAGKKYRLELKVNVLEKSLAVILEGTCMILHAPLLPDKFYAGIMASEGINRFYNFEVTDYG